MGRPGTQANPLRVAIIGSGPSGFYAAGYLQRQTDLNIEIDMFDRLPTPYGLVRGGVAPDHPKIKSVTRTYDQIACRPGFHFYGNVEFGTDVTRDDLVHYYHALIYAVGAQSDRKLDVPGEDLPGNYSATDFVAWYNSHPDYRHLRFDLSHEAAAVVGVGNVAIDVARILSRSENELYQTDIADYALQATFTSPEVKAIGDMELAEVVVDSREVTLDPLSQEIADQGVEKEAIKNLEYLRTYAEIYPNGKPRKIVFRFLVSPVEIIGRDRVEAIKIVKNRLYYEEHGMLRPRATGEFETIPVGLVFRSVGYRGIPLPGVAFHEPWGIIPNVKGRVLSQFKDGTQVIGDYVVGWIKRGPTGVVGTNKPDSTETVEMLLEDVREGKLHQPDQPGRSAVEAMLDRRGVRYFTFEDWQMLDQLESERGRAVGRPRVKFCDVDEMLEALEQYRVASPGPAGD